MTVTTATTATTATPAIPAVSQTPATQTPAEQMADKIVRFVEYMHGGVTLHELVQHLGEDAQGDLSASSKERPNTVFWVDVSQTFLDGFNLAKPRLSFYAGGNAFLTYMYDRGLLNLPLGKKIGKRDFKRPTWVPMIL